MIDLYSIGARYKIMDTEDPEQNINTVQVVAQGELQYLLDLPPLDVHSMDMYFSMVDRLESQILNKVSSPWKVLWMDEDIFSLDDIASNLHGEYTLVILSDDMVNSLTE